MVRAIGLSIIGLSFSAAAFASGPDVSDCPTAFHGVSVHTGAKLCQIFDSGSPSSLVYHVPETPQQAISFFLDDTRLTVHSNVRNRTLLMSGDKNHRVIVSPDGKGSQIDILIISPQS
jgi:hypothetical protein